MRRTCRESSVAAREAGRLLPEAKPARLPQVCGRREWERALEEAGRGLDAGPRRLMHGEVLGFELAPITASTRRVSRVKNTQKARAHALLCAP